MRGQGQDLARDGRAARPRGPTRPRRAAARPARWRPRGRPRRSRRGGPRAARERPRSRRPARATWRRPGGRRGRRAPSGPVSAITEDGAPSWPSACMQRDLELDRGSSLQGLLQRRHGVDGADQAERLRGEEAPAVTALTVREGRGQCAPQRGHRGRADPVDGGQEVAAEPRLRGRRRRAAGRSTTDSGNEPSAIIAVRRTAKSRSSRPASTTSRAAGLGEHAQPVVPAAPPDPAPAAGAVARPRRPSPSAGARRGAGRGPLHGAWARARTRRRA